MIRLRTLPVLAALGAVAAAAPVPEGAKTPPYYYPVTPGAKWVYDCPGGRTESVVVGRVEKAAGELVVTREGADENRRAYAKTAVSPKGLRQDNLDGRQDPVWLLKAPFRDGDSWDVPEGHGGGKRTVHGPERVEVPAGKFRAARVVWERPGGSRRVYWYAQGVGEVKRVEQETDGTETVTRALKSFTPAKN
jgi:hypothetical protein